MRASLRIDQGKRFSTINALIAGCILGLWLTSVAHGQEQYTDLFQEVLDTLNNNFYDSALILESIPKFEDRYGAQVQQIGSHEEFAALVNEMLGELNASHTNYLTPRDFEYYQLAAIFQGIPRIGALFEEGHVLYPSIGIIPLERAGSTFVASVLAGSEADRACLQMGDEILAADGRPFSIISSFRESVGEEVVLEIMRETEAPRLLVSVVPAFDGRRRATYVVRAMPPGPRATFRFRSVGPPATALGRVQKPASTSPAGRSRPVPMGSDVVRIACGVTARRHTEGSGLTAAARHEAWGGLSGYG